MGKKRKSDAEPKGPREVNAADARFNRITSYKDVADDQDEFLDGGDQVMFDDDDEPGSKRQRRGDSLELSDEEVLGYDDDDEEDDYEEEEQAAPKKGKKAGRKDAEEDEMDVDDKADGWWGTSKGEYYNADNPETEADALEEEVEAKRLQKKKLAKMAEEDFMFDEAEWAAAAPAPQGDGDANVPVTEVLTDFEVPADLTPEDRYKLLQTQYPEFDHLVQEFNSAQPLLEELRRGAIGKSGTTVEVVKYWVLGCYVAALGSYFAILTSPARDLNGSVGAKALNPAELRDHEVMETLVRCRNAWLRAKDLASAAGSKKAEQQEAMLIDEPTPILAPKKTKEDKQAANKKSAREKAKAKKAKQAEADVADLYDLKPALKPALKRSTKAAANADNDSDFGEEEVLDADAAAEKAARKKSLRFYTSQIVQKASKRHGAGRDAGGDMDIPHRERFRDREIRPQVDANSVPLGTRGDSEWVDEGDSDDGGRGGGGGGNGGGGDKNSDEEYYDMVASASRSKKDGKQARKSALAQATALDRVVEVEEVGDDGKRKITYAIEKNKGLTPRRKKEVRNPRVKYRKKMEQRQKKLVSMRGSVKTEGKYGYQGERTGINTRVIKSTKL